MTRQFVRFSVITLLGMSAWACGAEPAPSEVDADEISLSPLGNGPLAESPTITDVADEAASDEAAPEFTVLREALEVTGLDDALARKGQLTVFAPTDAAFERLLEQLEMTKEELFEDEELVEDVLLYHIANGRRTSDDVLDAKQIRTLDGRFIYPFSTDGGSFIRDGSEDTPDAPLLGDLLDIEATNGIVHGIDEVLLPGEGGQPGRKGQRPDKDDDDDDEDDDEGEFEGMATLLSVDGDAPARTMRLEVAYGDMTVEVVVAEDGTSFDDDGDLTDFDALREALEGEDPMVEVEGEGEEQDDGSIAASEIKAETEDDDGDDDDDTEFYGHAELVSVEGDSPARTLRIDVTKDDMTLTVDIFEGETEFEDDGDLGNFQALLAALESDDTVVRVEGEGYVRDDGTVEAEEIEAWAMVVEPPPVDDGNSIADVVTKFANAPEGAEFTILYAALDATGLLAELDRDDVDYTVFAPTDAAFGRVIDLLGTTAEALLADTDLLEQVLLYHVVDGSLSSTDVASSPELVTVQGSSVFPEMAILGTALRDVSELTSNAPLLDGMTDVPADNGVIHVLGEVMLIPLGS